MFFWIDMFDIKHNKICKSHKLIKLGKKLRV